MMAKWLKKILEGLTAEGLTFEILPGSPGKGLIPVLVKGSGNIELMCIYTVPPNFRDKGETRCLRKKEASRLYDLRLCKWKGDFFTKKRRDFLVGGEKYAELIDEYVQWTYPDFFGDWLQYFKNPTFANYCKVLPFFLKHPDVHADLKRGIEEEACENCLIMHPMISPNKARLVIAIFLAQRGFIRRARVYKYWNEAVQKRFKITEGIFGIEEEGIAGKKPKDTTLCDYVIDHVVYPLSFTGLKNYLRKASIIGNNPEEVYDNDYLEEVSDNDYKERISAIEESSSNEIRIGKFAQILGISTKTLWRYTKKGLIETKWNGPRPKIKSHRGRSKTIVKTPELDEVIRSIKSKKERREKRQGLIEMYCQLRKVTKAVAKVWISRQIKKGKSLEEIEKVLEKLATTRGGI